MGFFFSFGLEDLRRSLIGSFMRSCFNFKRYEEVFFSFFNVVVFGCDILSCCCRYFVVRLMINFIVEGRLERENRFGVLMIFVSY